MEGNLLEKRDTALVIIAVQVNMFSPENPVYQGEQLLAKVVRLREKAWQAHVPIIYIQHGASARAIHWK